MEVHVAGRVEGKVAVVTGAGSGLGAGIAERLGEEGATVVVTDLQEEAGRAVAERVGGHFVRQDVTDEDQWTTVLADVESRFGGLHILVNNAGVAGRFDESNPENTALDEWRFVQKVNVEGVFLGCRAAIPVMTRSGGGAIVNMSSTAAIAAAPDWIAYGASKATVRHMTRSVAAYTARSGSRIRCNSVHPGIILTPLFLGLAADIAKRRDMSVDDLVEEFRGRIPQGEFQEPEDIANAVLYLASDEAKRVTGIQIVVDGGSTTTMQS
jgi:NAD(P)-dependent dehydrogenase (short-subunit alcohol dehydrogenase family)